jgi:ribonuclease HI
LQDYFWSERWLDYRPGAQTARNVPCAFPKGLSTKPLIASDGSYKDDHASFAVVTQNLQFSSTLPGRQTIQRAELFGIFSALWVTNPKSSVTVVTDSYSAKSIIGSTWSQRAMPRQFSNPANKSILSHIQELMQERHIAGSSTSLTWSPSHSGSLSLPEMILNDKADKLAGKARKENHLKQVFECNKYLERFLF